MRYEPIPDLNYYLSDNHSLGYSDLCETCIKTFRIVLEKIETGFYYN